MQDTCRSAAHGRVYARRGRRRGQGRDRQGNREKTDTFTRHALRLRDLRRALERRGARYALREQRLAARLHRAVERVEHLDRRRPVDTRVGDAHAVLQRAGARGRHVLPALVDVALDHHARNVALAGRELRADVRDDARLVEVVLVRVAVCTGWGEYMHQTCGGGTHDCSRP